MISASIPNEIRRGVYRRDGYACALCGDPRHLNVHHAVPRGEGGGNSPCNLITLCRVCHAQAHGTELVAGFPLSPGEVMLDCIQYLADMYTYGYAPFDVLDYSDQEDYSIAVQMIADGIRAAGREVF